MNCDCLTSRFVKENSEKIWEKFSAMNYGDTFILEIKLPECGCTDENCFDYGTRRVYDIIKTEMVEVEPYFCENKNEVVEKERNPGLEFRHRWESWYKDEQKWDINLFGEEIVVRLQFNDMKHTIKISHYDNDPFGLDDCNEYHESVFEKEKDLIEKFILL